jgi:hypothetical protein
MERESFEDPEVAQLLNEAFICMKVDREERPDIDSVYMTVCQLMTGQGGWPLTILMTSDRRPFFAATYLPKESRFGRMGLKELITRIRDLWADHREELLRSAERTTAVLHRLSEPATAGETLGEETLYQAYCQLSESFDVRYGGFGRAPKFPIPHQLMFLLRYWKRTEETHALAMVEQTLKAMGQGGIYDHVGLGFHRYSTDERWVLPHFEKMLYDQALSALAYLEAYQATGREEYAQTAREVFEYVLRDLSSPEGGFYSAEDADSEGEEGKFYTWTLEEIRKTLEPAEAELVIQAFNAKPEGNYVEEATGRPTGRNVLHLTEPLAEELEARWESVRRKLLTARGKRVRPARDEKILTDWNGLMIAALARGAQVLDDERYAEAAERAAEFLLETLRDADGKLLHRYCDGEAAIPAFLDDYAFLIWGLIELYKATFRPRYLREALQLNEQLVEHFWDEEQGGFFFTANDAESVLVRRKEVYDGAVPSGNAVAMFNLLRLARLTGRSELEEMAQQLAQAFSAIVKASPISHTQLLIALDFALGPALELVLVGEPNDPVIQRMLRTVHSRFLPHVVVLLKAEQGEYAEIAELAPFTRAMRLQRGKATAAYICRNFACEPPVTSVEALIQRLP